MVLKINKKKLRALTDKGRKAKPKILKEHHKEFITKFVDEQRGNISQFQSFRTALLSAFGDLKSLRCQL